MSARGEAPSERPVAEHPFLAGLDSGLVRSIAAAAKPRRFEPGEMIVQEGLPAREFFLIEAGKVALEIVTPDRPRLTIQTLGPGEVLGWSWLTPPYLWRHDARALKPTRVHAFEAAALRAILDRDPAGGYQFLLRLLPVVAQRLEHTHLQLLDIHGV